MNCESFTRDIVCLNNKIYFYKNNSMNLILTGVTGTLGSQVCTRFCKKSVQKIFLNQKERKVSAYKRLENILGNTATPKDISQNRKTILEK